MATDRELQLLGDLCVALAQLGFGVRLRDAVPGLTVTSGRDSSEKVSAYVVVHGGERFSWWAVTNSHPADDVEGAASQIAEFLASAEGSAEL